MANLAIERVELACNKGLIVLKVFVVYSYYTSADLVILDECENLPSAVTKISDLKSEKMIMSIVVTVLTNYLLYTKYHLLNILYCNI